MLFFGHVGVGEFLARPFSKGIPSKAVLLGTVLPDLIDKSIYYIPSLITGRHGAELGFISGTRTIGHCFLFLFIFAVFAFRSRKPFWVGVVLGMFTHIPLDVLADYFRDRDIVSFPEADPIYAYFFPFLGFRFPVIPYESMSHHAARLFDKTIITTELLGLGLLVLKFRKRIVSFFAASLLLCLLGCGPGLDTEKSSFCSGLSPILIYPEPTPTQTFGSDPASQSFGVSSDISFSSADVLLNSSTSSSQFMSLEIFSGPVASPAPGTQLGIASSYVSIPSSNTQYWRFNFSKPLNLKSGDYFARLSGGGLISWVGKQGGTGGFGSGYMPINIPPTLGFSLKLYSDCLNAK